MKFIFKYHAAKKLLHLFVNGKDQVFFKNLFWVSFNLAMWPMASYIMSVIFLDPSEANKQIFINHYSIKLLTEHPNI